MPIHVDRASGKPHIDRTANGSMVTIRPIAGRGQDGSNVLPTDTAIAAAVNTGSSLTWAALQALLIPFGHRDYSGSTPLAEWATLGPGSALHLLAGTGTSAPYVLGIGVDHDHADATAMTGQTISVKSPKGVGLGINLETTTGAEAIGFLGGHFGPGKLVELRKGSNVEATGPLVSLRNDFGGVGDLLEWGTTAGELKGYIDSTGALVVQNQTGMTKPHLVRLAPSAGGGGPHIALSVYTGSGSTYWQNAIDAYSNHMTLLQANGAAVLGAETMNTMLEFVNGNQIGFFGVTPVTRPAAITAPTAPSATYSQSEAASMKTAVDAIRNALKNLGLTS